MLLLCLLPSLCPDFLLLPDRCPPAQGSAAIEERSEWELAYACPSQTAPAFLEALGSLAARLPATGSPALVLQQLIQLVEALKVRHRD